MAEVSQFGCIERELCLNILDFSIQSQPSMFKASLSASGLEEEIQQPILITIQSLHFSQLKTANILHTLSRKEFCPGAVENKVNLPKPKLANILDKLLIEKMGKEVVYRSRECEMILIEEEEKLCYSCRDLFKSLGINLPVAEEETQKNVFEVVPHEIESLNFLESETCLEQPLYGPEKNIVMEEVFHSSDHSDDIGGREGINPDNEDVRILNLDQDEGMRNSQHFPRESELAENKVPMKQSHITCNLCPRRFKKETALATHFKKIHNSGYLKKCPFCDLKIDISESRETFYEHVTNLHDAERESDVFKDIRKEFKRHCNQVCQVCEKTFRSWGNYTYHMKSKHTISDPKTYQTCHICGKLMSSNALHYHLKTVHVFEPSSCSECGVSCKNKNYLRAHMRTHNTIPFPCETCGKNFRTKRNLTEHITCVHLKYKGYKCEHCGKGFPAKSKLKSHILCLHTPNEDKPIFYEQCEYRCSRKNHIKNNHRK